MPHRLPKTHLPLPPQVPAHATSRADSITLPLKRVTARRPGPGTDRLSEHP